MSSQIGAPQTVQKHPHVQQQQDCHQNVQNNRHQSHGGDNAEVRKLAASRNDVGGMVHHHHHHHHHHAAGRDDLVSGRGRQQHQNQRHQMRTGKTMQRSRTSPKVALHGVVGQNLRKKQQQIQQSREDSKEMEALHENSFACIAYDDDDDDDDDNAEVDEEKNPSNSESFHEDMGEEAINVENPSPESLEDNLYGKERQGPGESCDRNEPFAAESEKIRASEESKLGASIADGDIPSKSKTVPPAKAQITYSIEELTQFRETCKEMPNALRGLNMTIVPMSEWRHDRKGSTNMTPLRRRSESRDSRDQFPHHDAAGMWRPRAQSICAVATLSSTSMTRFCVSDLGTSAPLSTSSPAHVPRRLRSGSTGAWSEVESLPSLDGLIFEDLARGHSESSRNLSPLSSEYSPQTPPLHPLTEPGNNFSNKDSIPWPSSLPGTPEDTQPVSPAFASARIQAYDSLAEESEQASIDIPLEVANFATLLQDEGHTMPDVQWQEEERRMVREVEQLPMDFNALEMSISSTVGSSQCQCPGCTIRAGVCHMSGGESPLLHSIPSDPQQTGSLLAPQDGEFVSQDDMYTNPVSLAESEQPPNTLSGIRSAQGQMLAPFDQFGSPAGPYAGGLAGEYMDYPQMTPPQDMPTQQQQQEQNQQQHMAIAMQMQMMQMQMQMQQPPYMYGYPNAEPQQFALPNMYPSPGGSSGPFMPSYSSTPPVLAIPSALNTGPAMVGGASPMGASEFHTQHHQNYYYS